MGLRAIKVRVERVESARSLRFRIGAPGQQKDLRVFQWTRIFAASVFIADESHDNLNRGNQRPRQRQQQLHRQQLRPAVSAIEPTGAVARPEPRRSERPPRGVRPRIPEDVENRERGQRGSQDSPRTRPEPRVNQPAPTVEQPAAPPRQETPNRLSLETEIVKLSGQNDVQTRHRILRAFSLVSNREANRRSEPREPRSEPRSEPRTESPRPAPSTTVRNRGQSHVRSHVRNRGLNRRNDSPRERVTPRIGSATAVRSTTAIGSTAALRSTTRRIHRDPSRREAITQNPVSPIIHCARQSGITKGTKSTKLIFCVLCAFLWLYFHPWQACVSVRRWLIRFRQSASRPFDGKNPRHSDRQIFQLHER